METLNVGVWWLHGMGLGELANLFKKASTGMKEEFPQLKEMGLPPTRS